MYAAKLDPHEEKHAIRELIKNQHFAGEIKSRIGKEIEIFPREEDELPLKSILFNFPVYKDGEDACDFLWDKSTTVSTCTPWVDKNYVMKILWFLDGAVFFYVSLTIKNMECSIIYKHSMYYIN